MITLTSTHEYAHGESLVNSVVKAEVLSIRRGAPLQLRVSFYRNQAAAEANKATIQPEAGDALIGLQIVSIPFETLGTENPVGPKVGAVLEKYLEGQIKVRIAQINAELGATAITYA